jgi:hypothetical protein
MNRSESIKALAVSLAKAQSEVENASKSSVNPHFKSKYADLAEIINTVRPVFTANGLSIVQSPSFDGQIASVETMLIHTSGEFISGVSSCTVTKNDAQGVGSATTYLRRYSLAALACIAQEDDDANAAVGKGKAVEPKITEPQIVVLNHLVSQTSTDMAKFLSAMGAATIADMTEPQYKRAVELLNMKKEKANAAS